MAYDPKRELEVLKRIRPNAVYSEQTRKNMIRSARDLGRTQAPSFIFMHRLAISGGTFALVAVLVGGYFGFQQYSGSRWSALNPAALRAEAEAVEAQVRIAEVKYQEATAAKKPILQKTILPAAEPTLMATAPSVGVASDTMTIDEALDILTQ